MTMLLTIANDYDYDDETIMIMMTIMMTMTTIAITLMLMNMMMRTMMATQLFSCLLMSLGYEYIRKNSLRSFKLVYLFLFSITFVPTKESDLLVLSIFMYV